MSTPPKTRTEQEIAALHNISIDPSRGEVRSLQGRIIGNRDKDGLVRFSIRFKGKRIEYKRSHVIWWSFYGSWPSNIVKHIDGNITNDAIGNLKLGS